MSLGYAEKLTFIEDVGNVGMSEIFDPPALLQEKIERLALMIKMCKHLVVFTGAGISTSCGIPDFRGPKGIWTLQREGKALPEASLPFHRAMPGMTHMALVELEKAGILKFLISQNIDGLHLRSGIPRDKLSELHGNSFMELCRSCGAEYFRDFEVETIGLKNTPRRCTKENCRTRLKDTVLDWEDPLPSKEINSAEKHCRMADIVLCLGTSLQVTPASNLPLKCLRGGGKLVIVNLQNTPKDKKASMVIRGRVDKVIAGVIESLNLRIPPFVRIDFFTVSISQVLSIDEKFVNWVLRLTSVHGQNFRLPFVKSVEVSFVDCQNFKEALLETQPFKLKRRTLTPKVFEILLKLNLSDGCGCTSTQDPPKMETNPTLERRFALLLSNLDRSAVQSCLERVSMYFGASADGLSYDKDAIIKSLEDTAIQDTSSGQNAIIERSTTLSPKTDTQVFALVTNVVDHEKASKALAAACVSNGNPLKMHKEGINGTEILQKHHKRKRSKRKS